MSLHESAEAVPEADRFSSKLPAATSENSAESADFEIVRTVGRGSFGTALLVKRKSDQQLLVLKQIDLDALKPAAQAAALQEVEVLAQFNHANIIQYHGCFQEVGASRLFDSLSCCSASPTYNNALRAGRVCFTSVQSAGWCAQHSDGVCRAWGASNPHTAAGHCKQAVH